MRNVMRLDTFRQGRGRTEAPLAKDTPRDSPRAGVDRGFLRSAFLLGWFLSALGICGPWLKSSTTALSLGVADLGEFVKFLPAVQSGTLHLHRQLFYLPPAAFAVSVAMVASSPRLRLAVAARCTLLGLGALTSLQLLPPAWTPVSLRAEEFRAQLAGLALCWLLLLVSGLFSRLRTWLAAVLAAVAAGASQLLAIGQLRQVLPEVNALYGHHPGLGWGFWAAIIGALILTGASIWVAVEAVPASFGTRDATSHHC